MTASRWPATSSRSRSSRASSPTDWCGPRSTSTTTAPSKRSAAIGDRAHHRRALHAGRGPGSGASMRSVTFASRPVGAPRPAEATGEVIGAVLEQLGTEPDVAAVFASPQHATPFERHGRADPAPCSGPACSWARPPWPCWAARREVEDAPAVGLWAGSPGGAPPPGAPRGHPHAVGHRRSRAVGLDVRAGRRAASCSPTRSRCPVDAIIDALAALDVPGRHETLSCRSWAGWRRRRAHPAATAWCSTTR